MVVLSLLAGFFSLLLVGIGFCVTLHLAARYILGPVSVRRAWVGFIPALVVFAAIQLDIAIAGGLVALFVDFIVIRWSYRLPNRTAVLLTIAHYTISVLLAFSIRNIVVLV